MEKTEAEKILKEKLETAEKILVGIGADWKRGDEDREEQIRRASKALRKKKARRRKRSFMPPKS